jgi:hypothetical protein
MLHTRKNYPDFIINIVNTKIRIAVAQKAEQFPRISTHLMMAE